ncbi:N-acetyltransferase family protein [Pararhizobium sp. LjRoot238]|uniref:GNAT family N-acetyltransferase n=1 Tax=Pararhizobium sp. LjRoot238 TaxID=3342293 RepID=UPI003F5013BC
MVDPSPPLPHVRLVVAEDAKLIHAGLLTIAKYLGSEERVTSTPDDIRRHGFGAQQAFTVLIAEIEGAFAGMCLFFQSFSTWRGQKGAYIQDIVVEERFRGAGVGGGASTPYGSAYPRERWYLPTFVRRREERPGAAFLRADGAFLG